MNKKQTNRIDKLIADFEGKKLTRRDFIKRSAVLGLSSTAIWSVINQSGSGNAYGAEVDRSKLSKTLNIYNWSDYIAEDTIPNFEKEFGVKVIYDTYEDNDSLLAKLLSGASGYDVVSPTSYMVDIMIKQNLLAPINHDNIPNIKGVIPSLLDTSFDPKNTYSVPYQWGTTGFAYNSNKIKSRVDSWKPFWDEAYRSKITMLDDVRACLSAALKWLGYSLNSTEEKELQEAKDLLLQQKPLLKAYISAPVKSLLISEEVWLSELWCGDVFMAKSENDAIDYCIPKEGCEVWTDNLVIPKSAPHKYTAEVWLNYTLRPDVSGGISNMVHYASPVAAARSYINKADLENPGIYPPDDVLEKLEFIQDVGEATRLYDQIWIELKAA